LPCRHANIQSSILTGLAHLIREPKFKEHIIKSGKIKEIEKYKYSEDKGVQEEAKEFLKAIHATAKPVVNPVLEQLETIRKKYQNSLLELFSVASTADKATVIELVKSTSGAARSFVDSALQISETDEVYETCQQVQQMLKETVQCVKLILANEQSDDQLEKLAGLVKQSTVQSFKVVATLNAMPIPEAPATLESSQTESNVPNEPELRPSLQGIIQQIQTNPNPQEVISVTKEVGSEVQALISAGYLAAQQEEGY
jgi:hypothetical protein